MFLYVTACSLSRTLWLLSEHVTRVSSYQLPFQISSCSCFQIQFAVAPSAACFCLRSLYFLKQLIPLQKQLHKLIGRRNSLLTAFVGARVCTTTHARCKTETQIAKTYAYTLRYSRRFISNECAGYNEFYRIEALDYCSFFLLGIPKNGLVYFYLT